MLLSKSLLNLWLCILQNSFSFIILKLKSYSVEPEWILSIISEAAEIEETLLLNGFFTLLFPSISIWGVGIILAPNAR